jgi:hypothetical protein
MAEYDNERVKKILRMAESEHDGEAAAAMRKLTAMAKAQSQNLDEMMAVVYGGARASGNGSARQRAEPDYDDMWNNIMREGREKARRAEEGRQRQHRENVRRAEEERQRQHRENVCRAAEEMQAQMRKQREAREQEKAAQARKQRAHDFRYGSPFRPQAEPPPWERPDRPETSTSWGPRASGRRYTEPLLQEMSELSDRWGSKPLSMWEENFVFDILGRGASYSTSPAQDEVIRKIIEKYKAFASRNGDEAAFWGR